jgi:hypothetical protein
MGSLARIEWAEYFTGGVKGKKEKDFVGLTPLLPEEGRGWPVQNFFDCG